MKAVHQAIPKGGEKTPTRVTVGSQVGVVSGPVLKPPAPETEPLQLTSDKRPKPDPYCHSGREGRPRLRVMLVVADVDGVGPATKASTVLTP